MIFSTLYFILPAGTVTSTPSPVRRPGIAQHLVELQDAAFDERLIVLGVLVLGVFGDVPEFLAGLDTLRDLLALHRLEVVELVLELAQALGSENRVLFGLSHASHLLPCEEQAP